LEHEEDGGACEGEGAGVCEGRGGEERRGGGRRDGGGVRGGDGGGREHGGAGAECEYGEWVLCGFVAVDGYVAEWDGVWGWVEWDDDGGEWGAGVDRRRKEVVVAQQKEDMRKIRHDHESAITGEYEPNEPF